MTSWPAGGAALTSARFSATVRPVIVTASPWSTPWASRIFITCGMPPARPLGGVGRLGVLGGHGGGVGQAHAQRLDGRGHRVGSEHASARPRARTGAPLDLPQVALGDLSRPQLADRLEDADDREVLS